MGPTSGTDPSEIFIRYKYAIFVSISNMQYKFEAVIRKFSETYPRSGLNGSQIIQIVIRMQRPEFVDKMNW